MNLESCFYFEPQTLATVEPLNQDTRETSIQKTHFAVPNTTFVDISTPEIRTPR